MDTNAGPYQVSPYDPRYRMIVGYLGNCGYYFNLVDSRLDEDDQYEQIASGGLDGELAHLVQLLEVSGMYFDWSQHTGVLRELARYDAALTSRVPRLRQLLADALAT